MTEESKVRREPRGFATMCDLSLLVEPEEAHQAESIPHGSGTEDRTKGARHGAEDRTRRRRPYAATRLTGDVRGLDDQACEQ